MLSIDEYMDLVHTKWIEWDDYKCIKNMEGVWIEDYGIVEYNSRNYHKFIVEDWTDIPKVIMLPVR